MEEIKKYIECSGGEKIQISEYSFGQLLDEFCYYLKEEGIKGLGREHIIAGFTTSKNAQKAIDKMVKEKMQVRK